MKKIIFFLCLFLSFQVIAQTATEKSPPNLFQNKKNLSLFSGLVLGNKGHIGTYVGLYGDLTLNKNPYFMNGIFAQVSRSGGKRDSYSDHNYEYGGGYFFGFYRPEFSKNFQSFFSSNIGLLVQKDKQLDGFYSARQNDLFLKLDANLNFLKKNRFDKWFPRTQIEARYKNSLKASKIAFWEDEMISPDVWSKDHLEIIFKQSLFRDRFSKGTSWSPKIVGYYSHAWGDGRSFYGVGIETSLFKMFRDDFLSLQVLYKRNNKFTNNYLVVGLNFNLMNLTKQKNTKK